MLLLLLTVVLPTTHRASAVTREGIAAKDALSQQQLQNRLTLQQDEAALLLRLCPVLTAAVRSNSGTSASTEGLLPDLGGIVFNITVEAPAVNLPYLKLAAEDFNVVRALEVTRRPTSGRERKGAWMLMIASRN